MFSPQDEITGSLPMMDPSQPMPFPESNYTEEDSSDDVEPDRRTKKRCSDRGKRDNYRSGLVIYHVNNGDANDSRQQQQQQHPRGDAGAPTHLDSLTTATGFTSFGGDDFTSFNTSVADMSSMPRPKNHQECLETSLSWPLSMLPLVARSPRSIL